MKLIRYTGILIVIIILALVGSVQAYTPQVSETAVDLIRSDDQKIEISVKFPSYETINTVEEGGEFQMLLVPGTDTCTRPGQPELPVKNLIVAIPPGVKYDLKIIQAQVFEVDGTYRLPVSPAPKPVSTDFEPGIFTPADPILQQELSQSGECMPVDVVNIAQEAWVRDQRILNLQVFPFRYSQIGGRLQWYPDIRFEIQFEWDNGIVSEDLIKTGDPGNPFEKVLKNTLLNYDQASNWRGYSIDQVHPYQKMPVLSEVSQGENELYKISISEDGFYKLTYEELSQAGVPVDSLNPTTLRITNQGDEVAIYVHNIGSSEIFSPGEYLIFYGQQFSGEKIAALYPEEDDLWISYPYNDGTGRVWDPQFNAKMVEKYTDQNVYWLSFGGVDGKRMQIIGMSTGGSLQEVYKSVRHEEQSNVWRANYNYSSFASEDTWYWEMIDSDTRVYTTTISYPASGDQYASLRGRVVAQTYDPNINPDHQISGYLNDPGMTDPIFIGAWDGKGEFIFEGLVSQNKLNNGLNHFILAGGSGLYFDWFELEYDRQFIAVDNRIWFSGADVGANTSYEIAGFQGVITDDINVFDISDPQNPILHIGGSFTNAIFKYTFTNTENSQYYVGIVNELSSTNIKKYKPIQLSSAADYVIIAHNEFLNESQRLADYRNSQGLSTLVLDIEHIINEFNFGIYHPIAIKNFIAFTFDPQNWSHPPTYVLLVGDGHWNFLKYPSYDSPEIFMPPNIVWVDPWQGEVDSANLLANVVNSPQNPDPIADVLISRLPVNDIQEYSSVINKIISYEGSNKGDWQRRFVFIADDTDQGGNFSASADAMAKELQYYGIIADKIYLADFQNQAICKDDGSPCPEMTNEIFSSLEKEGSLFVNYYGHGYIYGWSSELVLLNEDVQDLRNTRLPIIFSSTCLDGYWYYPNNVISSYSSASLIEEIIRFGNYGAVAAFSPTGLGLATGHDYLQDGFYNAYFSGDVTTVGGLSLQAKLRLWETGAYKDLLHTYTVFGDPALQLPTALNMYRTTLPMIIK